MEHLNKWEGHRKDYKTIILSDTGYVDVMLCQSQKYVEEEAEEERERDR